MKKTFYILSLAILSLVSCSSDDSNSATPITTEATTSPNVGGPNQPNQVFVDLSANSETAVQRDSWDLGFYCGNDFRVIINGAISMAVKKTTSTDISEIQTEDSSVSVGYTTLASLGYADNPTGILQGLGSGIGTAIAEISTDNIENFVYVVNMGYEVSTTTPATGSVSMNGDSRGWKKIRITRSGSNYVLQYANLDASTAETVTISKDSDYNFKFFNLETAQTVNVQPKKENWDINLTGFTNYVNYGSDVLYFYSDFVSSNILGGTQVYEVVVSDASQTETEFENFVLADVDNTQFTASSSDQRIIGSNWRNGGGPTSLPSIKDDRFYIIKDNDNNIYKLRFLAMSNDAGERGNPTFTYKILN